MNDFFGFETFEELDEYLGSCNGLIIHQIWFRLSMKSKKLYNTFTKHRNSWRSKNPGWLQIVWNEKLANIFMKKHFEEYWHLFKSYKHGIQRVDTLRYFLLYTYGGLYVDMDMVCVRSFNEVRRLYSKDIYLSETPNQFFDNRITNALMYSIPKHPFWKYLFMELSEHSNDTWYYTKHQYIMYSTGPRLLNKLYNKYIYLLKLNTFPYQYFNPIGLKEKEDLARIDYNSCYCYHIGTGTWESIDSKILVYLYSCYKLILLIVLLMSMSLFVKR